MHSRSLPFHSAATLPDDCTSRLARIHASTHTSVSLLEQVLDKFLEWRLDGGPKLGLVTDYDERITTILENLGISHYFDVVVSSR